MNSGISLREADSSCHPVQFIVRGGTSNTYRQCDRRLWHEREIANSWANHEVSISHLVTRIQVVVIGNQGLFGEVYRNSEVDRNGRDGNTCSLTCHLTSSEAQEKEGHEVGNVPRYLGT
jgi:hypothetical protein